MVESGVPIGIEKIKKGIKFSNTSKSLPFAKSTLTVTNKELDHHNEQIQKIVFICKKDQNKAN
jgi:hypothetical protein